MQIRFPRKLRLGFRPLYGLTIRQLIYLGAFTVFGGIVILAGPIHGTSILVRAVIGIALVCAGLGLAFLRIGGLTLDTWLPIVVRYFTRPRRRVWRKRTAARAVVTTPPSPKIQPAPRESASGIGIPTPNPVSFAEASHAASAPLSKSALVLLDAFVLGSLGLLTLYLQRGGWAQIENFWAGLMR